MKRNAETVKRTVGPCTLHRGDCFDVIPSFKEPFDAVIADPPYGVTQLDWDTAVDWNALWPLLKSVRKDASNTVFFSQQPFTTKLILSNPKEFRYELIWYKNAPTGFLDANRRPLRAHENILVFIEQGRVRQAWYEPQKTRADKPYRVGGNANRARMYGNFGAHAGISDARHPVSVWLEPVASERMNSRRRHHGTFHPTQKPVGLMEKLVRSYVPPGGIVLDPFMGSGSTAIACIRTGRRFVGIELSREYFDIAENRIRDEIKTQEDGRNRRVSTRECK